MSTEPKRFKDISLTRIFTALVVAAIVLGIEALAVYRFPHQRRWIGNVSFSLLAALTLTVLRKNRKRPIHPRGDAPVPIRSGFKEFFQRFLVLWAAFFTMVWVVDRMVSE